MLRVQRPAAEKLGAVRQDAGLLLMFRLGSEITRDDLLAALRSTRRTVDRVQSVPPDVSITEARV
jgi:hypothetical protein